MLDYEGRYSGKVIAGIDEAGRGPLAGPVVCACVIMPLGSDEIIDGINDSKKLSEKKREELYDRIIEGAFLFNRCCRPEDYRPNKYLKCHQTWNEKGAWELRDNARYCAYWCCQDWHGSTTREYYQRWWEKL